MRSLLAEQFKLAVHRETRDFRCTRCCSRGLIDGLVPSFTHRLLIAPHLLPQVRPSCRQTDGRAAG